MDGRGFVVLFYVTGFCNSIESRRSGIVSLTCTVCSLFSLFVGCNDS